MSFKQRKELKSFFGIILGNRDVFPDHLVKEGRKDIIDVMNDLGYEYVILDCPPNINLVTQNSFFSSQYFIIPAIPDFLSTVGISLIKSEMEKLNKNFKGMIEYSGSDISYADTELIGIIFNMVDEYGGGPKGTHNDTISSINNQHPDMVFDNYITDGDGIAVAADNNMTVYSYDDLPKSRSNAKKQAEYLENVVDELLPEI